MNIWERNLKDAASGLRDAIYDYKANHAQKKPNPTGVATKFTERYLVAAIHDFEELLSGNWEPVEAEEGGHIPAAPND